MPNQRKPNKKLVTVWLDPEEKETLEKKAKRLGHKSVAAFFRSVIKDEPAPYGKDKK